MINKILRRVDRVTNNVPLILGKTSSLSKDTLNILVRNFRQMIRDLLNLSELNGERIPDEFEEDPILTQERFEPAEWVRSMEDQISTLRAVLPRLELNEDYLAERLNAPSIPGTSRVALPSVSALGRLSRIDDPYSEIGVLIEQVCRLLEDQREGRFTHYRKNALGPDRVQVVSKIAQQRKSREEK